MTDKEIRRSALRFRRECLCDKVPDYDRLYDAVQSLGYTVVEFNECCNEPEVESLIRMLRIEKRLLSARGFTYANEHHRLVFVNEKLSDEEKAVVLAHECGHIRLGHLGERTIFGDDVRQEYAANEFAHYVMHESFLHRAGAFLRKRWIAVTVVAVLLCGIAGAVFYFVNAPYFGRYYLTKTGKKYHTASCVFIAKSSYSRRMTKDDYASGFYEPCSICMPEVKN